MQVVLDNLPVLLVLIAGVSAPVSGWLAASRARHRGAWFVLGALIGPIAWLLLIAAPPGRCPTCDALVRGWPRACERCGARFDTRPGTTALPVPPAIQGPRRAAPTLRSVPASVLDRRSLGADRDRASRWGPGIDEVTADRRPHLVTVPTTSELIGSIADPTSGERVLSAGVYLSGNAGLEVGATYAIALVGLRLRIFGPVDAGQLTVRHEDDLDQLDILAVEDRLIISGREGHSSLAIIFRAIGGMQPDELDRTLKAAAASAREVS